MAIGYKLNEQDLMQAVEAVLEYKSYEAAALALGLPRSTVRDRYKRAESQGLVGDRKQTQSKPFVKESIPSKSIPLEDLIEQRKQKFRQLDAHEIAKKLTKVHVKIDGPIGIVHIGDPHVDDDGTDIALIERHIRIINSQEALFGANLGDLQNNWIGRLARLWANQSTSSSEAWQLTEWMVKSVDWLYLVAGNHDCWSGNGDPLNWIMKNMPTAYDYHGVRIALEFPNKKSVRVNARHDFTGHSMWNPVHGPMKAAQGGWRDHILTCGHKHTSFVAGPLKDPSSGLLSWAIRCAGYKIHDSYASEKGLPDQNAFPACVTIIDPQYGDDDPRLVTVIPSVEEGADYLKFKRRRAKL